MSAYPPPPNQRFPPPPGAGGGASGQFPPPPGAGPPQQAGSGGFPPPPSMMSAPPPQQRFAPPPPMMGTATSQLNTGMASMSLQGSGGPPPPPVGLQPPPQMQAMRGPPGAPGGFMAPPPPGAAGGVPSRPPAMFHAAPQAGLGPPAPMMMKPPQQQSQQQQQPEQAPAGMLTTPASSPFFQQPPSASQMQRLAGGPQPGPPAPSAMTGAPGAGPGTTFQENLDFNIKVPDRLFRMATSKIPQTAGLAAQLKIPLGGVLRPLAPLADEEDEVDTVQPCSAGIVRCKKCRAYMNAFVTWVEQGRRWRCNICGLINDCPSNYFCHLDEQGLRRDRMERPELSKGVVEYVAPAEYMVRPPQEPCYFFVLDVSATAVRSGMLECAANAIKQSLDDLPGRNRTKVGFITFDNSVHYYNLASDLSHPQMLVVSDLKELFVPLPDNLLVNLKESRAVVDAFLDSLPEMFTKSPVVSQSCLGPALKAAFTVMKQIGGKMCVFQSILPNLGDGALKPRENPQLMGTPNEIKLLRPDVTWYKDTAIEFSRQQICVDMFLFPYQYMDFASLGELPKLTAGTLFSYVMFHPEKDGPKFESQLIKTLTTTTAFEAVVRIRCTRGMRITNFYGNFYIRGTDLLALPNCNSDAVFGFDLAHDEQNITSNYITVQSALLYTSSEGERRIRVMTQALLVTSLASDVISSIDVEAMCNLLSKHALDVALKTTLDNGRIRLQQACLDIIRAAKSADKRTVSGYAVPPTGGAPQVQGGETDDKAIPENLQLLPLYTLAMMKNVGFRGGTDVHPDERVQAHHLLNVMWLKELRHFVYPRMFSIHDMEPNAGYSAEDPPEDDTEDVVAGHDRIFLPPVVNLSIERLTSDGIFLLDNGVDMYLWVGRSADPGIVNALFGVESLENIDMSKVKLLTAGDEFASRVGAIVQALREDEADPYVISPKVNIIREGDARMEGRFFWFLVEDRASFQGGTHSYSEFMHFVNNPGGPGAAVPPGGPSGHGAMGARGPPGGGPAQARPPPQPGMGMGAPPPQQGAGHMAPPHQMAPPMQAGMGMAPPMGGAPPPRGGPPPMGGPSSGPPPSALPQGGPPGGAPYSGPPGRAGGPPMGGAPPPTPASNGSAPPTPSSYGAPPPMPSSYAAAPPKPQQQAPPTPSYSQNGPPPPARGPPSYATPPPAGPPQRGNPPPTPAGYGAPPPGAYGMQAPPPQRPPPPRTPGMPPPPPPPPGSYR